MEPWQDYSRLHCEHGPALAFADGWAVYSLHGVKLQKEIVMTPADKLRPQLIITEQNSEIRKEIVRKIGIERCLRELGATVVDKKDDIIGGPYELILLDAQGTKRPYLRMVNPSTGTTHIEGVHPDCKTVEEALHWRKPPEMQKIPVTDDGEEWVQHGDILIWPEGALSLKQHPVIIT